MINKNMTLDELERNYGVNVDVSEAQIKNYGVTLEISDMPTNGETRIRLKFDDGTTYIRTLANGEKEGWQNAHYHRGVSEMYIVQKGSIVFAEYIKNNDIGYHEYAVGDVFTVKPNVEHNIYMMKGADIHTVKYGIPVPHPDKKDKADWWDDTNGCALLNSLKGQSIDDILNKCNQTGNHIEKSCNSGIIVLEKRKSPFTKAYMHFDKLIWQFPLWIFSILTIGIAVLKNNNKSVNFFDISIGALNISSFFFLALGILGIILAYTMYRFRYHQMLEKKEEKRDGLFTRLVKFLSKIRPVSPQKLIQIFFNALVSIPVLFFIDSLVGAMPTMVYIFTFIGVLLISLFLDAILRGVADLHRDSNTRNQS
jgi:mannose-6-phosphate isomerase-like protein (cupin superfamily)